MLEIRHHHGLPGVMDARIERFAQPAFRRLVAMERMKLLARPMTRVGFCLVTILLAVVMTLTYIIARSSTEDAPTKAENLDRAILPGGIETSFDVALLILKLLVVVLAAVSVGSEYSWGTIRVLVGSGVSRARLVVAKFAALGQVTFLLLLAGITAGVLASLVATLLGGHALTLGGFGVGWVVDLVLMFIRSAFVLWLFALVAATITFLSRSVAAGIALGIVWFTMEPLAGRLLDNGGAVAETVRMLLISTNVAALTSANGFGSQSVPDGLPGIWQATGLLIAYAVLLILVAVSVFRARDIASVG